MRKTENINSKLPKQRPEFEEVVLDKGKTEPKLSKEQQEIVNLKSQLMIEKIKNTGKSKKAGYFERKRKRRFRDTEFDKNATTKSLIKGGLFMAFSFGMIILLLLIIS